jgi:hypothetical protein
MIFQKAHFKIQKLIQNAIFKISKFQMGNQDVFEKSTVALFVPSKYVNYIFVQHLYYMHNFTVYLYKDCCFRFFVPTVLYICNNVCMMHNMHFICTTFVPYAEFYCVSVHFWVPTVLYICNNVCMMHEKSLNGGHVTDFIE